MSSDPANPDPTGEPEVVGVRLRPPRQRALERIIGALDDCGNPSDALRELIDRADPDGDEHDRTLDVQRGFRPDSQRLRCVYDSLLDRVEPDHILTEDQLPDVAQEIEVSVANIRRRLSELESNGFVSRRPPGVHIRQQSPTDRWAVKPVTAVPDEWRYHPENERERQRRRKRERINTMCQRPDDGEA